MTELGTPGQPDPRADHDPAPAPAETAFPDRAGGNRDDRDPSGTDQAELEALIARQRHAFDEDPYPALAERQDRLARLEALIRRWGPRLAAAIDRDFGQRPAAETQMLELAPLLSGLRHTRRHLKAWMRPERRRVSLEFLGFSNRVIHQPLGVIGIMAPWNYPLMLTLGPLIDGLAAGNRALVKPSELLPETSALLQEAVAAHFDPAEVAVVTGGVALAAAFAALPFDHLLFTGSTAVGRKVAAAAAPRLTPLTLELGGKSPAIVTADYPLSEAARDLAFGKLMNAGQTCIAPDYVLAPRDRIEPLAEALLAEIRRLYPGARGGRDFTSLVGARALPRLQAALAAAEAGGATLRRLDDFAQGKGTSGGILEGKGARLAPTLVIDPPRDGLLMQEELFGPVLPLIGYDTLDEALAFVRARPRPLALYLFSRDRAVEDRVLHQSHSGNVTVNGTLLHVAQHDLPFGGIGPSGLGAYHGRDGFRRFSHAKGIARVGPINPARLATPPYGWLTRLVARVMMR